MKLLTTVLMVVCANLLFAQGSVIKEGHRGCRGLMPENTIAAMKKALDLGVQVLELDVVISKDKQVLVSHDPYFSAEISLKPSGEPVTVEDQKSLVLYALDYSEIRKFDVGTKHNAAFTRQQNFHAYKPLLSALIDSVDKYAIEKGMPLPNFNIEIKSQPQTDDINHPKPQEYVELVMDVCKSRKILDRMDIQSFDVRPLQLLHQQNRAVKLSYLTANTKTVDENLKDLGFTPDWYSPYYKTVTSEVVKFCHEKGIKIVPWTVNTKEEINALIKLEVDAIITDYPDLF